MNILNSMHIATYGIGSQCSNKISSGENQHEHRGVSEKPPNQNSASPTGIKQFQPIWKLYIKGCFVVTSRTGPTFDLQSDIFVCFLLCFYKMVLLNDLPQKVQCFKIIVYCNFFIQNALLCLNFIIYA